MIPLCGSDTKTLYVDEGIFNNPCDRVKKLLRDKLDYWEVGRVYTDIHNNRFFVVEKADKGLEGDKCFRCGGAYEKDDHIHIFKQRLCVKCWDYLVNLSGILKCKISVQ